MRLVFLIILSLVPVTLQTNSANIDGFQPRVFKNTHGESMPYRLFLPANYDARKKYPIVLWLHGGGGRGTDNLKQISGGNTSGTRVWVSEVAPAEIPRVCSCPTVSG
jgi:predicted peptidase